MTGDRWVLPNGVAATELERRTIGKSVVLLLREDCTTGFAGTEWILPIVELKPAKEATCDRAQ